MHTLTILLALTPLTLSQQHCLTDGQYCAYPAYEGSTLYSCTGADLSGTEFDCTQVVTAATGEPAPGACINSTDYTNGEAACYSRGTVYPIGINEPSAPFPIGGGQVQYPYPPRFW